jgi:hypothetical protein
LPKKCQNVQARTETTPPTKMSWNRSFMLVPHTDSMCHGKQSSTCICRANVEGHRLAKGVRSGTYLL